MWKIFKLLWYVCSNQDVQTLSQAGLSQAVFYLTFKMQRAKTFVLSVSTTKRCNFSTEDLF